MTCRCNEPIGNQSDSVSSDAKNWANVIRADEDEIPSIDRRLESATKKSRREPIEAKIALPSNELCRGESTMFRLTPPNQVTFIISVVIAVIAVIFHYAHIAIPHVTQTNFVALLIGYLVLLAGNVLEGV
jgi:hypothetical protein